MDEGYSVVVNTIAELEQALSFFTEDCRLAEPVTVSYEITDGEGFIRIRTRQKCAHGLAREWAKDTTVDTEGNLCDDCSDDEKP